MKKVLAVLRNIITDAAKLRLPVIAAAAVTTIVGALEPFGVDLSKQTTRICGVFVVIGLVSETIKRWGNF